uniref:Uncharacterized protein n=1 Tax=Ascaris lumbricoides TaxID=6252 RepID=A0A0M3HI91_ASCLU
MIVTSVDRRMLLGDYLFRTIGVYLEHTLTSSCSSWS